MYIAQNGPLNPYFELLVEEDGAFDTEEMRKNMSLIHKHHNIGMLSEEKKATLS